MLWPQLLEGSSSAKQLSSRLSCRSSWLPCGRKDHQQRGYSTCLPAGTAVRELREGLDHGADVDLASQPVLLLTVILKVSTSELQLVELQAGLQRSKAHLEPLALQDFLRNIPGRLLVSNLYEDWMAAMQKTSREENMEELKA